jgi:hypothetical protein
MASVIPPQNNQTAGLLAGEALGAGDACYIRASDGRVMRSTGAAANAAAKVRGWAAEACASGEAITLFFDVVFRYGAALTPGADYFVSGTVAGGIADAASTGGTAPVAYAVDATRIAVLRSRY